MTILLTAFEPFNDALNSSQLVVESLGHDFNDQVRRRIMPVDTVRIAGMLEEALREVAPDFCLFTGQATGYSRLTLERMAINFRDLGGSIPGDVIEPGGPVGYWSTLPDQEKMIAAMNETGIPSALGNYAGSHLCNQILYHALYWSAHHRPEMKVGFLHIPLVPEQISGRFANSASMPLEMSRQGVEIVLRRLFAGNSQKHL